MVFACFVVAQFGRLEAIEVCCREKWMGIDVEWVYLLLRLLFLVSSLVFCRAHGPQESSECVKVLAVVGTAAHEKFDVLCNQPCQRESPTSS